MTENIKGMPLSFYISFTASILLMLLFDPGTNGNNLNDFSTIKLALFILVNAISLLIILAPMFNYIWRFKFSKTYIFICLVFIPVNLMYLYEAFRPWVY